MSAFQFFSGDDDFLLNQRGDEVWQDWISETGADDYSREVFDGRVNNVADLEKLISQLRGSLQSMSLFGGCKLVWIKNFNALADSVTGRAKSSLDLLDSIKDDITHLQPDTARLLITASPVDRRRAFYKWIFKAGAGMHLSVDAKDPTPMLGLIEKIVTDRQVSFDIPARELLIAKVSANARVIQNETEKLATMVGDGGTITEHLVHAYVPVFGDTDFFEAAEVFYQLDLRPALVALDRYFFTYSDARGLISNLQGRNRLLIQLKSLLQSCAIRLGARGIDKRGWDNASHQFNDLFPGETRKSPFNIFSQNAWYAGRLAATADRVPLRKLINFQLEFTRAFEGILARPNDQPDVLRDTFVRCLS
ncbi:MAG: DNA polymerase III subunit delta [Opitutales bacterium]|nr:DNA polymerase III subunit delta [Opitutales bacterium]